MCVQEMALKAHEPRAFYNMPILGLSCPLLEAYLQLGGHVKGDQSSVPAAWKHTCSLEAYLQLRSHVEGAKPYQRCQAISKVPSHVEAYLLLGGHVEGDQSSVPVASKPCRRCQAISKVPSHIKGAKPGRRCQAMSKLTCSLEAMSKVTKACLSAVSSSRLAAPWPSSINSLTYAAKHEN